MTSQEFEGAGGAEVGGTDVGRGAPGSDEVAGYASEVRAQFADLSAEQSADLLEDLEDHLREVAAEGAGTLRERLGAPAVYARELRQAAGLPEPGEGNVSGGGAKQAGAMPWWRVLRAQAGTRLAEADRRIRVNPAAAAVLDFLPSLRPAWWVLRAWVVVRALQVWTTYVNTWHEFSLIPRVNYSTLTGTLCLLVAIPVSVYLGRRNFRSGWPRRAMLVGQSLAVLFTVGMALGAIQDENDDGYSSGFHYASQQMPGPVDGLVDDGKSITNLYLYDQNGRSLSDVLVYDQDGRPVNAQQGPTKEAIAANTWRDANGMFVSNVFPRQILGVQWNPADGIENYVTVPPPSVTVPPGVHRVVAPGLPQDSVTTPPNTSNTSTPAGPTAPASPGASGAQSSSALPPAPTSATSKG